MIQKQAYGIAAGSRGGHKHDGDLPVVELSAIGIPGMDSSFETARTVLQIAGVTLMAIDNGDADPAMIRQCFIALQPVIDMVDALS